MQVIAEVRNLDKWTALRQGRERGYDFKCLTPSEDQKSRGEEGKEAARRSSLPLAPALAVFGGHRAGSLLGGTGISVLILAAAHCHTQNTCFFPQRGVFLRGGGEAFRGQFGSKLWNFLG